MAEAFIALGGNVGDVRATFDRAIAMLCDGPDVRLMARSSDYRTPPWGVTDQPPFTNAVIAVSTTLAPHAASSRARKPANARSAATAPRNNTGDRVPSISTSWPMTMLSSTTPTLTLPHPRLFERAFVLVPLAEIAPDRVIAGIRVSDALERVDAAGIERLPGH